MLQFSMQNLAFFGTSCPEGSCSAVVCRIADNTLMGQIAGLAMSTDNDQTPINKEIQHFIKVRCPFFFLVFLESFVPVLHLEFRRILVDLSL